VSMRRQRVRSSETIRVGIAEVADSAPRVRHTPGMVMPPSGAPFIDPIQFPVAAAAASTRDIQQRAAAAAAAAAAQGAVRWQPMSTPSSAHPDPGKSDVNGDAHRTESDRDTTSRIAALASNLIGTRASESIAVVVDVQIPSLSPALSPRIGLAEVYRAWPLGEMPDQHGIRSKSGEWAVTATGSVIWCMRLQPSVALDKTMRWVDPARQAPTNHDLGLVLRKLEAAATARTMPATAQSSGKSSAERLLEVKLARTEWLSLRDPWYLWLLLFPVAYPGLVTIAGQEITGFAPPGFVQLMYFVVPGTVGLVFIMALVHQALVIRAKSLDRKLDFVRVEQRRSCVNTTASELSDSHR
jgi:hypothetical protein